MAARNPVLREGTAPVRDRLLTMLFLAGLLHGIVILGLTFNAAANAGAGASGLQVLLVSDELPEAERNDTATYLAQRTQLGSGNTRESVAPRNPASSVPIPGQEGFADGNALAPKGDAAGTPNERVLTTTAWSAQVRYLSETGNAGRQENRPLLLEEQPAEQPGPSDETGPAQLRGPQREELWVTPDTRAATLAPYLDSWRRKVERIGTLNYPTAARGQPAASPVLEVGINADGKLDKAALEILKLASPFDPFPAELAREYRVLRFAYEWQFVGGRLEAGAVSTLP
jgi:protein TonB